MPKTISILGCGWLGEPLAEHLLALGYQVKGSTTTSGKLAGLVGKGIQPYLVNLDPEARSALPHDFFGCDVLFLNIPPGRRDPNVREHFLARVGVTCSAIRAAGPSCVILASSTSVYPDLNRVVHEDDAGNPATASGQALLEAERMLQHEVGFRTTLLRFAGLYGYDRRPGRFLAGKEDVPDGDAPVNLVHRDDCIRIVAEVIHRGRYGDVFNVCSDQHPPRRVFYPWAARQLGLQPPTFQIGPAESYKIVSNTKVKEVLGYTFSHPDPMQPAP
ncbi:MAG TPA: SDR family oxidoreductase [Rhodothermales bacterium]|nr:SDR family oxidoreductase [Rhodothermales bacterium]